MAFLHMLAKLSLFNEYQNLMCSSIFCDQLNVHIIWQQGSLRSSMCERLWCTSPEVETVACRTNNRLMALPGTTCGYGMVSLSVWLRLLFNA